MYSNHRVTFALFSILTIAGIFAEELLAQGSFYAGAPGFYRGSTIEGDALRGYGAVYYGQGVYAAGMGHYAQGMAQYVEAVARSQVLYQEAYSLEMANRERAMEIKATHAAIEEAKRESRVRALDARKRTALLIKFRDAVDPATLASGESLNFLLAELGDKFSTRTLAPIPLAPVHITEICLETRSGLSLADHRWPFDARGRIQWPACLGGDELTSQRTALAEALKEILDQMSAGKRPSTSSTLSYETTLRALSNGAKDMVVEQGPRAWSDFRKFMDAMQSQYKSLTSGDGYQIFDGTLAVHPRNSVELLNHVRINDLRFANANAEGVRVYTSLHRQLAELHRELALEALAAK